MKKNEMINVTLKSLTKKAITAACILGCAFTVFAFSGHDAKAGTLETQTYTWYNCEGGQTTLNVTLDKDVYNMYHAKERTYNIRNYNAAYIQDSFQRQIALTVANAMKQLQVANGWSEERLLDETARMVQQSISYQKDCAYNGMCEYPKYPVETLFDHRGDCEDSAMLLATLLRTYGYQTALVHIPGHVAVAVESPYHRGSYYNHNGGNYYFIESTGSGWQIGEIPSDCTVSATLYDVN